MNNLDPDILDYLRRYAHRRRTLALTTAACRAICILFLGILLGCLADRILALTQFSRALWLTFIFIATLWPLKRPALAFTRQINWITAANQIESHTPHFQQRLQTLTSPSPGASPSMLATLTDQILSDLPSANLKFQISNLPPTLPLATAALLTLATASIYFQSPQLLQRTLLPFSPLPPVTTTQLSVELLHDPQFTIQANAKNFGEKPPTLEISGDGITWHHVAMTPISSGQYVCPIEATNRQLQYFVEAGDAKSELIRIGPNPK